MVKDELDEAFDEAFDALHRKPKGLERQVRSEIEKVERESKAKLDTMEAIVSMDKLHRDELVQKAVVQTAQDIVTSVMRANADALNKNAAAMIEELVGDRLDKLGEMVDAAVNKRLEEFVRSLQSMDARERQGFLAALDEIGPSLTEGTKPK